ncbi:molybdopterin-containing oxidoreductase family protein [Occallatibacter riparius]|uniref:Molybdopterin-dependent oxidoreductase n=1 Tax=Occallatibacter riparius TaxID=1002689 RepID=A0A9J7BTI6_9BACT|nr:molybdopterin-dependent oxidoreductase [Occallatibacter riparius]UWZ85960.1 molybdopterin-dependent oxidoreductase [Occallatibacter riparius]
MGPAATSSPFRVVHTVCSHDCPDSCGVLVTVNEGGRAVKVEGDPAHPVTNGFLCGKVAKYLDRVYSPDRVLYPLRRKVGVAKGPLAKGREHESFERIPWDEALEAIAERLKQVADQYGPESILPYSYAGNMGLLGYGSMDRRFFHRMGASQLDRTICAEAGGQAWNHVYGKKLGTPTEDVKLAKLIIAWGANIHGNNIHLWPMVEQARRNGARLIVIDPYRTRTAALADWHIAIRPGTDVALALGLMHVILRDGIDDRSYIDAMTVGFDRLAERVREYTPERVAHWTGMTAAEVEQLAREYATTLPSFIRTNYGVQRGENGGAATRAICMLPAITGAWKHRGGGAQLSTSGAFKWDKQTIERPDLALKSPLKRLARVVNMSTLGQALTELGQNGDATNSPAVHALFVYNSNPGAVAPNHNAVVRGLARPDLFTVVHEQFLTDTTDYADYILPATTFLEHIDAQGAYGHYFAQYSHQAIEPLGEARSNVWLFSQLAQRMGFEDACFRDTAEEMIAQALAPDESGHSTNPGMENITLAELQQKGHVPLAFHRDPENHPFKPFTEGAVLTPSGKIEFYSEALGSMGLDPLPGFIPPTESRWSEAAKQYPLELLGRKNDNYMNSTFANLPGHRKMESRTSQRLEIHPVDAEPRGIADGDRVRVSNGRGSLLLSALINEKLPAGVVAARLDWAKLHPDAVNVNALTSERLTDIGAAPTFYSTLVEVVRDTQPAPKG